MGPEAIPEMDSMATIRSVRIHERGDEERGAAVRGWGAIQTVP
jgi:hypothetical protein